MFNVFLAIARLFGYSDITWLGNMRLAQIGSVFAIEYVTVNGKRSVLWGVGSLQDARATAEGFNLACSTKWVRAAPDEDLQQGLKRIGMLRMEFVGMAKAAEELDRFATLILGEMKLRSAERDRQTGAI